MYVTLIDSDKLNPLADVVFEATFIKAYAEEIVSATKTIRIRPASGEVISLQYDHLLLGFGSNDADSIEGIKEYGYRIKSPEEFGVSYIRILELVNLLREV